MKLKKETVTVELKNGTVISGSVAKVDPSMNIHLSKVKMTVRGKNPETLDSLSVRGSTIRSVILPDSINLDTLLIDDAPKKSKIIKEGKDKKKPMGRGRGRGRGGPGGRR
jgi:small nuclear ribonucleoprotein D1